MIGPNVPLIQAWEASLSCLCRVSTLQKRELTACINRMGKQTMVMKELLAYAKPITELLPC